MAHVRPRQQAVAEARANAAQAGYFVDGGKGPIPVRIDSAPQGGDWLIAIACNGNNEPLEGARPSSPFRDIIGETFAATT